ncbi:MAG: cupin domain-containing protein [Burkholderiales bacterium]|jgi:anti-sigma factor ChrR (cupin superfamily)
MSAITPGVGEHAKLPAMASRFVDVASMPWQKSRFEGIETKTLLVDKSSGLLTMLMKMAPGVKLPDHEHVEIEQSWIFEGSLDCGEGSCTAGNFVWRPAGSRHDAWAGPEGVVLLGMFQLPNRFFEGDGRDLDFLGQDWDKTWGDAQTRRQQAQFA